MLLSIAPVDLASLCWEEKQAHLERSNIPAIIFKAKAYNILHVKPQAVFAGRFCELLQEDPPQPLQRRHNHPPSGQP